MFRLTREVRFALNSTGESPPGRRANGHSGDPPLSGIAPFLVLRITLQGSLDPFSNYLENIKTIDERTRACAIPLLHAIASPPRPKSPAKIVNALFLRLQHQWPPAALVELRLLLSPYLAYGVLQREHPMIRLSHRFEFSAAHRLFNPSLSEAENAALFGKCSNPQSHGHNYELEVTLRGSSDASAPLLPALRLNEVVQATVIDRFDHRHLNVELPEFRERIPTVENISRVIYGLLKPRLAEAGADLAAVTVWETPRTWCEYAED